MQDLTVLAGEITITMNWFNRHPVLDIWKPTFHCIAEPGSAESYDDPTILPRILSDLDAQAYFLRTDTKKHFDRIDFAQMDRVYFVKMGGLPTPDRDINLTQSIPGAPDTSILATMIAIALGCSPIYLIGVDYDWLSHRSLHRHFYDENDPVEMREDLRRQTYLQTMEQSIHCWRSHEALREIALRRGQRIFNATEGGFLDVYPIVTLSQASKKESGASFQVHGV